MMKKKQSRAEEAESPEHGEEAENKEINSQEESSPEENSQGADAAGAIPDSDKEASPGDDSLAKLAEMQDRYLRLSAEFDNYRKRTLREKIELTRHAGENILVNIIPVMDDFERALKSMESATDCVAMKAGIDLIYNKFRDFLTQNGIREIEALSSDFNVDIHDAVSKTAAPDESLKGKVVDVVQKGYYLHDKVVRHSRVIVGE